VQIFAFVAGLLALLSCLIAFVLLTLSAWRNDSSFTAVVQSGLISGVAKASTAMRKRSKAEEANIDALVSDLMNDENQEAAAEAAEDG
jgi:predicted exporter